MNGKINIKKPIGWVLVLMALIVLGLFCIDEGVGQDIQNVKINPATKEWTYIIDDLSISGSPSVNLLGEWGFNFGGDVLNREKVELKDGKLYVSWRFYNNSTSCAVYHPGTVCNYGDFARRDVYSASGGQVILKKSIHGHIIPKQTHTTPERIEWEKE